MNALTPVYVRTQNFILDRAEAYKRHLEQQDRGATLVEYATLIVLAAALLGALYASGVVSKLRTATSSAVSSLFSQH